jgi:hypothetical protein
MRGDGDGLEYVTLYLYSTDGFTHGWLKIDMADEGETDSFSTVNCTVRN